MHTFISFILNLLLIFEREKNAFTSFLTYSSPEFRILNVKIIFRNITTAIAIPTPLGEPKLKVK